MPMDADSQEKQFLAKIAQKLGRATPEKISLRTVSGPPDFGAAPRPSKEKLLAQFSENAGRLTIDCRLVRDKAEIRDKLREVLAEVQARSVICWDTPNLKFYGIADACNAYGLDPVIWDPQADRQEMIRKCAAVDVGITWADFGIADSGSLAVMSSSLQSRSVSLLPPVHIAMLARENILPQLGDVFAVLQDDMLPSSLTFITGPSRTSDIEMDLALGVHGPGKVFVFILDAAQPLTEA
jgi:L-lactate dehydrogenase complex protein LldG